MSRNLLRTDCARCGGEVATVGPNHPITKEEARAYFDEYAGMEVADAACTRCQARYLAWMAGLPHWPRRRNDDGSPIDLSFRSTFDDEPGLDDLPAATVTLTFEAGQMRPR